jgi:hypothetical protein
MSVYSYGWSKLVVSDRTGGVCEGSLAFHRHSEMFGFDSEVLHLLCQYPNGAKF